LDLYSQKAQSDDGDKSLMTFDEFVALFRFLTNRPDLQVIIKKFIYILQQKTLKIVTG